MHRSHPGRWASRLSLGITDRLTDRLGARWPDALVTDQPQTEAATCRLLINISRLDVNAAGIAELDANWTIVPRDPAQPVLRDRVRLGAEGPVATDQDVVRWYRACWIVWRRRSISAASGGVNGHGLAGFPAPVPDRRG